jgi:hypothetical protein
MPPGAYGEQFRPLRPGQRPLAREANAVNRAVSQIDQTFGTGVIGVARELGGIQVRDFTDRPHAARITGAASGDLYPHVEVQSLGGVWADVPVPPGVSGSTTYQAAREANGRTDVPEGTWVWLEPVPDPQEDGPKFVFWYGSDAEPYALLKTCPVLDCTNTYQVGEIGVFRQADGSIVCVDIPPGNCCDEWWCTEEGVVSQPIADRGTPPEGAISGPYPVEELAETACVEQVELCDCGPPQNIPRFLHYEFRNRTGSAATLLPDELVIDYTGAGPHTAFDAGLSIAVQFDVTGEECSPEFRVHHTLGTHTFAIDTAAPNTVYGGFSYDLRAYADPPYDCDTNRFADALPLFLGTVDINGTGTFDWWLT